MQSTIQSTPSLDFEKEVNRAKWFMDDLKKGDWNQRYKVSGFDSWSKTFSTEEVPVKILFMFQDMPMPVEKFAEMMDMDLRTKWDEAFKDLDTLEVTPDGGRIVSTHAELSFPLTDRSFVFYISPVKEIDWYDTKGFATFLKDASHPSKPAGADGLVRATNGGNFYIGFRDDKEPEKKCHVFGLTNNNYNGWVPSVSIEWLVARAAPRVFHKVQQSLIQGYNKFFNQEGHNISVNNQ